MFFDRIYREKTDYHLDKYENEQIKEQSKNANQYKFASEENIQTSLLRTQMFEQLAKITATGMIPQNLADIDQEVSKKKVNIVQENLLKIEKINREASKYDTRVKERKPALPQLIFPQNIGDMTQTIVQQNTSTIQHNHVL